MKNLFVIIAMLFAINMSAQSLAERTGETKSLYNAACILYGIEPGSIGMNEGRILMQKYAKSIGLNYELYEFNAGNNLYILYFEPTVKVTAVDTKELEVNEYQISTIKLTIDIPVDSIEYNISESTILAVDLLNVTNEGARLINVNPIPAIQPELINADLNLTVQPIYELNSFFTCDCRDKDVEDLNQYYTELLRMRHNARGLLKDKLDACSYQLRKYKKVLEQKQRRGYNEETPAVGFNDEVEDTRLAARSAPVSTKSNRVRRLGNGWAKGKCNSIWMKIFPFANC